MNLVVSEKSMGVDSKVAQKIFGTRCRPFVKSCFRRG
jgi:hypothetical protein